jgi:hypothetical protein
MIKKLPLTRRLRSVVSFTAAVLVAPFSLAVPYGSGTPLYTAPTLPATASVKGITFAPASFDSAGINAAIVAAHAAGGGDVVLASGTYTIDSKVLLKSGVNLIGQGIGVTVLQRGSAFAYGAGTSATTTGLIEANNASLTNVLLSDFTVTGNWTDTDLFTIMPNLIGIRVTSNAITYNDTITLRRVESTQFGLGVHITGTTNISIEDCHIHRNGPDELWHNIYLRRVGIVRVSGSTLNDALAGSGLKVVGGTTTVAAESADLTIENNVVSDNYRNNCFVTGFNRVRIQGNEFAGQVETADQRLAGLYVSDEASVKSMNVDIINNTFVDNQNHGLHLEFAQNVKVAGNLPAGNGAQAYYVHTLTAAFACDFNEGDIVLDNVDPTHVTRTGSWTNSSAVAGYYGSNFIHDGNTGSAGGKSVRFRPNLPAAGSYAVYVRWSASANRASNAPIDVNHAAGTTTFTVDQKNDNGVWVLLGTFTFNAGTGGNVTVRNDGANGFVVADGVKFVRL